MTPVQPIELIVSAVLILCGFLAFWLAAQVWRNRNGGTMAIAAVAISVLYALDAISNGLLFFYYWIWIPDRAIPAIARWLFWPWKIGGAIGLLLFVFVLMPRMVRK